MSGPFCKKLLPCQIDSDGKIYIDSRWWFMLANDGRYQKPLYLANVKKTKHLIYFSSSRVSEGRFSRASDILKANLLHWNFLLGDNFRRYFCWECETYVRKKSCWLARKNSFSEPQCYKYRRRRPLRMSRLLLRGSNYLYLSIFRFFYL